jgi:hypothetical protein
MNNKYKDALAEAQTDLSRLEERRTSLLRLVDALKDLAQEEPGYPVQPAQTEHESEALVQDIRVIMGHTTIHLTPTQIRDSLLQRGFKTSNPKNLLMSVYGALGRLEDELDIGMRDGKPAYKGRWIPVARAEAPNIDVVAEDMSRGLRKTN